MNLRFLLFFVVLLMGSCKKGADTPDGGYPKEVTIEYKLTTVKGSLSTAEMVGYTNESDGRTTLTNVSLPFSKTIKRTVKFGDMPTLSVFHTNTGGACSIKMEILVNGKVAKTQTEETTDHLNGAMVYPFE
ncbi:hypothetical protein [Siphonobacter aquaeclarae]|uniref:Lipoprotein n=1 Tax=Siphonobacter aquaeclarae TaxID=563176 RepID=A0A1G9SUS3_9BACT|nr:hypothetical protein [Siphonobacter aquaeclarae]SDM39173.1 hypothetical protein SAMN04488090_3304 [Siphonobacter aquaeclarae]